jgi:hypothetical protein
MLLRLSGSSFASWLHAELNSFSFGVVVVQVSTIQRSIHHYPRQKKEEEEVEEAIRQR